MMKPQQLKPLCLVLSTMLLTACYPTYKILQPELDVVVQDEQGRLLDRVPITLKREPSVGLGYRYSREETQQGGKAHFYQLAEWRTEFLLIHGAVTYKWYLCVAQPGYEVQTDIPVEKKHITVRLKKTTHQSKVAEENINDASLTSCDQGPLFQLSPSYVQG